MTPMNNADYLTRLEHADELESLKAAKRASGLTYEQLAELIGVNKVWLASVFEGQHGRIYRFSVRGQISGQKAPGNHYQRCADCR